MSNKNKSTGSTIVSVIGIILVLVLLLGFIGVGFASDWFTDWSRFTDTEEEQPIDEEQDEGETVNGGAVVGEATENGVSLMSAKIATADYAEYGISPLAETAYTLRATITPSNANEKTISWAIAFANPSSTWASGKTVTDYVTLSASESESGAQITVTCLQAFGEQIIITASATDGSGVSATCTVDYVKTPYVETTIVNDDNSSESVTTAPGDETKRLVLDFDNMYDVEFSYLNIIISLADNPSDIGTMSDVISAVNITVSGIDDSEFLESLGLLDVVSESIVLEDFYVGGEHSVNLGELFYSLYGTEVGDWFDSVDEEGIDLYSAFEDFNSDESNGFFKIAVEVVGEYKTAEISEVLVTFSAMSFYTYASNLTMSDSSLIF